MTFEHFINSIKVEINEENLHYIFKSLIKNKTSEEIINQIIDIINTDCLSIINELGNQIIEKADKSN